MLFWTFLSAFVMISDVDAKIIWPFSNKGITYDLSLFLDVEIGTPPQSVQLRLLQDSTKTYLGVPSTNNGGSFDPKASSTFQQTGQINSGNDKGVSGTDTFVIGGATFKNLPLNVYDQNGSPNDGYGFVSIAYPNGTSFIHELLKTQQQKTATISYGRVDSLQSQGLVRGTLTLGGQANECSNQWTYTREGPHRDDDISWTFKADMLTAGRFQKRNPGIIKIYFNEPQFNVPKRMLEILARSVGSQDGWQIPCDTNTQIVFNVAGVDLKVGPETYLTPSYNDQCLFDVMEDDNIITSFYQLPLTALKDLCIQYNYDTKMIGFAKRVK